MGGVIIKIYDKIEMSLKNKLKERLLNFISEAKTECCEIGRHETLKLISNVVSGVTTEIKTEIEEDITKHRPDYEDPRV